MKNLLIALLTLFGSICKADVASIAEAQRLIPGFSSVSWGSAPANKIFRGSRPGRTQSLDADMKILKDIGIKTIIDLQGGDVNADIQIEDAPAIEAKALNDAIDAVNRYLEPGETASNIQKERAAAVAPPTIAFFNMPLNSLQPMNSVAGEIDLIRQILRKMHDPNNWPLYVHCEHGHDRTGMIVALYQVCFNHMPATDAYIEMLKMGHNPDDHVTQSTDIFFWQSVATDFCASL